MIVLKKFAYIKIYSYLWESKLKMKFANIFIHATNQPTLTPKFHRMKKSLYICILCGLCGAPAFAQSVTIVDKDGLTHKFPTESIKEITFEKAETPQPTVVFNDIVLKDWGGGNVNIVMTGENVKADLDVYGPKDATYLNLKHI